MGLLIRKQWADHSKLYLLAVVAIFGLMAIAFYLWSLSENHDPASTYVILIVAMFLGGSIFASMMFADLSQRTTGIYFLSVPATHAEKLVCSILYSQVLFNLVILISFFILQPITLSLVKLNPHMHFHSDMARSEFSMLAKHITLGYLSLQAFFLLGSVYFQRFAFIKTVVGGLLIGVVFVLFIAYLIKPIFPSHVEMHGIFELRTDEGQDSSFSYSLPAWQTYLMRYAVQYIWVPVFWAATYFRLKEKEL